MDALFAAWPWWVSALVVVASLVLARRLPPWAGPLLVSLRAAAAARLLRWRPPRLTVVPAPPPVSDGGVTEDRELPPAEVVVDGEGNPVQMGRTPEEIEADEKAGGSGG